MKCQIYDNSYCFWKMQQELKNEQLPDGLITQWWSSEQCNCTTKGYSPVQACIFSAFHVTLQVPSLMRWSPQPTRKKICQKYVKGKTIQGFASAVGSQSYEKSKGMHRANH